MQRGLLTWVKSPADACKKDLRMLKHEKRPTNAYPKKKEEKGEKREKKTHKKRPTNASA